MIILYIGIDVGGTNVDGVIISNKKLIKKSKVLIKDDLSSSIKEMLVNLFDQVDLNLVKNLNLSTTIATNYITTNKSRPIGLIVQNGPGLSNEMLAVDDNTIFIDGYIDHRGIVVKEINETEILEAVKLFKSRGIKDVGIVTKFSTRNNTFEKRIKELVKPHFNNVSLGSNLSGRLNFKRRIDTTYLNLLVYDVFNEFISDVTKELEEKIDISILKADGGNFSIDNAKVKPVETIFSGPSASLMGILSIYNIKKDAILLDIGGTTTDIFIFSNGVPLFVNRGIKIGKYKTLVRGFYNKSLALGGDSIIKLNEDRITIGPKRVEQSTSQGGNDLSLTDIFIHLNKYEVGDKALVDNYLRDYPKTFSNDVIDLVGSTIKLSVDEILEEVNSNPIYTIKELLEGKKINIEEVYVIGGPSKLLKETLEKHFNLPVIIPTNFEVSNAIGSALSKNTKEINLYINTKDERLVIPELNIDKHFDNPIPLEEAEELTLSYLFNDMINDNKELSLENLEIVESSSYNIVGSSWRTDKNIRVKAQVKPGLIYMLEGDIKWVRKN